MALSLKRLLSSQGFYISLNRCSFESGLGTLPNGRDRLASDEPKIWLPSPTCNLWVQECGPWLSVDTFLYSFIKALFFQPIRVSITLKPRLYEKKNQIKNSSLCTPIRLTKYLLFASQRPRIAPKNIFECTIHN